MKRPTIACCYFVHDDLPFLRATIPYDKKWADQICVLDLGSTDGTKEFCELHLDRNDKYQRREENTCPELGFSEAKNACAAMATTDWVFYGSADQMLRPSDHSRIHQLVAETTQPVLTTGCIHILPKPGDNPTNIERGIARVAGLDITKPIVNTDSVRYETHRRIVRNGSGIVSKGYIHEEPFLGEVNCYKMADSLDVSIYHFAEWAKSDIRSWRYCWMFKRASGDPELQKYTNRWWYDKYVPANRELIETRSALYEKYVAETGRK